MHCANSTTTTQLSDPSCLCIEPQTGGIVMGFVTAGIAVTGPVAWMLLQGNHQQVHHTLHHLENMQHACIPKLSPHTSSVCDRQTVKGKAV